MSEGGQNLESFAGAQPGAEKAQETQEQFQERYAQAQTAIQQVKKEEAKKKHQDDSLAQIIVQFLHQENQTAFFLLISRLVSKNIPSDFILSILALIYEPAAEAINHRLSGADKSSLPEKSEKSTALFTPREKEKIDFWMQGIMNIAELEKKRLCHTALTPEKEINEGVLRLFALVLRDFLEHMHHEGVQLQNLEAFGEAFFQKIAHALAKETEVHILQEHEKK